MSNLFMLDNIICGDITIDRMVPAFISTAVNIIKILIPIILIIFGILDLAKAITGNDEKVMKEAQGKLIKRIVYAVIVFFVVALVQFIFGVLSKASGDASGNSLTKCVDCFINNKCDNGSQVQNSTNNNQSGSTQKTQKTVKKNNPA